MAVILPVARGVYLCDYHVGYANGKIDLYGVFKAIRPSYYPHEKGSFVCFAQLSGGLGNVQIHVDIRRASDFQLVDCTDPRNVHFPDRDTLVQVAWTITGCAFDEAGLYLVELYCDNMWVTDTALQLREARP